MCVNDIACLITLLSFLSIKVVKHNFLISLFFLLLVTVKIVDATWKGWNKSSFMRNINKFDETIMIWWIYEDLISCKDGLEIWLSNRSYLWKTSIWLINVNTLKSWQHELHNYVQVNKLLKKSPKSFQKSKSSIF